MEFHDPDKAKTRDDCAMMFCSTIHRALSFLVKNVADDVVSNKLAELRNKYRTAYGTIISGEQIIAGVGPVIIQWRRQIEAYDDQFFFDADIMSIIGNIGAHGAAMDPTEYDDWRARFAQHTSKSTRETVLDALNLMIILYAKFVVLSN